jgi:HAD superfamily hydrolase (TIGR01509 family)
LERWSNELKRPFALIFDVDGTLAETERFGHRVAFNQAFAEAGLDWFWDEENYGRLLEIPGGRQRIEAFIEQQSADIRPYNSALELALRLHRNKKQHYLQLLRNNKIELRPGVARLIVAAHDAGIRLGICSTASMESVLPLLRATLGPDGDRFFDVISVQDGTLRSKPFPDLYLHALRKLRLDAADCIAIEDSEIGVRAASAAGIPVIACYNDYSKHQDFAPAMAEVDGFGTSTEPVQTRRGKPPAGGIIDVEALRSWWRGSRRRQDRQDHPPVGRSGAAPE